MAEPHDIAHLKHASQSRGIHTAYVGNKDSGVTDAGNAKRMITQTFLRGRTPIDPQTKRVLKDHGMLR